MVKYRNYFTPVQRIGQAAIPPFLTCFQSRFLVAEAVSKAAIVEDVARIFWVRLDLLAQMPDVTPDVSDLAGVLCTPNFLDQFLRRDHVTSAAHQSHQQLELGRGQGQRLTDAPDALESDIHFQSIGRKFRIGDIVLRGASKDGVNTRG